MFYFATESSSVFKIWKDGFRLFGFTFRKIWDVVFALFIYQMLIYPFSISITNKAGLAFYGFQIPLWVGGVIPVLSFLFLIFISSLALYRMFNAVLNPQSTFWEALKFVAHKYSKVFFNSLLTTSIMLLFLSACLGLMALIKNNFSPGPALVMVSFLAMVGVFGVLFLVFNIPEVLLDDKGPIQAVKGSFLLVWGNWWKVFACFLMPWVIAIILGSIKIFILEEFFGPGHVLDFWMDMISAVAASVIWVIFYCFLLVIYNDRKFSGRS